MCKTFFKKGQAALEFLMTYGWAILVVLVVIAALAYFGVLSPATLLPEKCTFPVSISCSDFFIPALTNRGGMSLTLQNGAGRDMTVTRISASSEALGTGNLGCGCSTGAAPVTFRNGASSSFVLLAGDGDGGSCDPDGIPNLLPSACSYRDTGRDKNRYNITVTYSWLDSPTVIHQLPGELLARRS